MAFVRIVTVRSTGWDTPPSHPQVRQEVAVDSVAADVADTGEWISSMRYPRLCIGLLVPVPVNERTLISAMETSAQPK